MAEHEWRDTSVEPDYSGMTHAQLVEQLRARDQAGHRLYGLASVSRQLAAVRDWPALMALVRRAARDLTGADGATLVLREDDHCRYVEEDAIGPLWKGRRFPLEHCISGWVIQRATAVAIEDIYQDERIPHAAYRPTFVKSLSMVPIGTPEPIGAIGCYWARQHAATPSELALQQALADAVAVAVANLGLRDRLEDSARRSQDSEARLAAFAAASLEGIVLTGNGYIEDCNGRLSGLLGYREQELKRLEFATLIDPHDRARVLAELAGNEVVRLECALHRQDGSSIDVEAHSRPAPQIGAGFRFTVIRDITERKRVEAALHEKQVKLRLFVEHAPAALAMFDREMRYLAVSRRWLNDYSLEGRDLIGQSHYAVFPEIPERWKAIHRCGLAGEVLSSDEDRFERADGQVHWLRWEVRPWHRDDGEVGGLVVVSEDITERKKAQDALRDSEASFRLLVEQAPDGIFVTDAQGRYQDVNAAGARMLGYSREEILLMSIPDIVMPHEVQRIAPEVARFDGGGVVMSEWQFRRKDGSGFLGEVVGRRLPDGRMQAVVRDITERHEREEALRAATSRLVMAQRAAGAGIWDWDMVSGAMSWSDELFRLFGLDPQRSTASLETWRAVLHPDDAEAAERRVADAVREHRPLYNDYRIVLADGTVRWVDVYGDTRYDAAGGPLSMSGICIDTTQRMQAEAALRESESFYRQTLESIPGMVFTTRADGYCDFQSQQWADYTGVPASEHTGDGWNRLLHPDDRARAFAAWRDAVAGKAPYELEYRVRRRDGVYEWFRVIGRPIRDNAGQVVRWFGVALNIEQLKQAEAAQARQRDALVREVHHRIKNHLQGVTGLLYMAIQDDESLTGPLSLVIGRIRSIAQVYGLQSRRGDAAVPLADLLAAAVESAGVPAVFDPMAASAGCVLSQGDAVPLALVLNELITNAAKHLRADGMQRPVRVGLAASASGQRITVASGPAYLPEGFDYTSRRGLGTGLELVATLLPADRMQLDFRQVGDEVVAELRLTASAAEGAAMAAATIAQ